MKRCISYNVSCSFRALKSIVYIAHLVKPWTKRILFSVVWRRDFNLSETSTLLNKGLEIKDIICIYKKMWLNVLFIIKQNHSRLSCLFRGILAVRWCVSRTTRGSRQQCYLLKTTPAPPVKPERMKSWSSPNWAASRPSWLRRWGRSYLRPPPAPLTTTAPPQLPPPRSHPPGALLLTPLSSSSISSWSPCASTSSCRNSSFICK